MARRMLDDVLADRPGLAAVPVELHQLEGLPGRVLVEQSHDADLLVVGHRRRRGGLTSAVLGSVGLQCVLHARCPVAVVRLPAQPRPAADERRPVGATSPAPGRAARPSTRSTDRGGQGAVMRRLLVRDPMRRVQQVHCEHQREPVILQHPFSRHARTAPLRSATARRRPVRPGTRTGSTSGTSWSSTARRWRCSSSSCRSPRRGLRRESRRCSSSAPRPPRRYPTR